MRNLLNRFWLWLRVVFSGKSSLREIAADVRRLAQETKDMITRPKKRKHCGTLIWDGRLGTYIRRTPKIGRNTPCPCGAMRTAPRDVTKRNKAKWCCHA